mgnify:CR=1 FL=1
MDTVTADSGNAYAVRPTFKAKFPVFKVKEIIREVLTTELNDVQYHIDHSSKLTATIADKIKYELKVLNLARYVASVCVQVFHHSD